MSRSQANLKIYNSSPIRYESGVAHLETIKIPEFGAPVTAAVLPSAEYEQRLDATLERMVQRDLDILLVYGDREHFANLAFLTAIDPRFEEALLLLDWKGARLLLLGNEDVSYVDPLGPRLDVELFQEFSLLGQQRDASRPLRTILADFGVGPRAKVGCVGWKYFRGTLIGGGETAIDLPSYLVDLLRELAGSHERVVNATDVFMDAGNGLRIVNRASQIAQFEYAATRTSESVKCLLGALQEGITERELANHLQSNGLPLSCHPMVSTGNKVKRGLSSPSDRRVVVGDSFLVAFGLWGALTCRAGTVAKDPRDLGDDLRGFFPGFATNYFEVVSTWYEQVRPGARAADVFGAVDQARDASMFSFAVNPGHSIHLDEWVNSPFFSGSAVTLRSGMALQMDIIPVSAGPFCCINAEDGIVLADAGLRDQLAADHPQCWARIRARREFMRETLRIDLARSVLPLSNTPGVLTPFLLRQDWAFVARH